MERKRLACLTNHTSRVPAGPGRPARTTEDEKLINVSAHTAETFTDTDPWRVLRILGEFVDGFDTLADVGRAVSLFGSARVHEDDPTYAATVEVARLLGLEGFTIITGGGPGLMEAGNKGASLANARSIGLNIELPFEQHINPYADTTLEFRYFFVRKTMFVKYACAFVIFPGGFGTLDELTESLVLIQTGKIRNFPIILFDTAYWTGFLDWARDTLVKRKMICPQDLDLMLLSDSPEEVRDLVVRATRDADWRARQEETARDEVRRYLGMQKVI